MTEPMNNSDKGEKCRTDLKRYKKLLLALAAVASIYVVRATGLDGGLVDGVMNAVVESVVGPEESPAAPETPAQVDAEKADQEALEPK